MADDPRIRRGVLAACALAIVASAALWLRLRPDDPDEPAKPPEPGKRDALVVSAGAGVERRTSAGWAPARAGEALEVTDSIRAGEGSIAEITLGPGTHITVAERSELTVRELTAAAQRVGLVRGRISVDVRPDGTRVLRVEDQSGKVAARGASGRFGVVASAGGLAIASVEGRVSVESAGRSVDVAPGEETVARRDAAPLAPRPVPREVVLRVARQIEERRASVCLVLHADPAAEVWVDGEQVDVPQDGTVVVRLPPRSRQREVAVVMRHATGAVERRTLPCWRYEGDVSELEVKWHAR